MIKKFMVLLTVVGSLFILLRKEKVKSISNSSSCNSTLKKGQSIGSLKSLPMTGKYVGSVGPITTIGRIGSTSNINR
ncbi:hypothetical protein [Lysinibacillus sphaericus]|uniref:hypothetical protein n=1 Tax=Lysinibacillus sphaericus TaxID=1421 RepID=UPI000C19F21F|nr:hypothetical protein [Lysinibacillus sphaericus]PIJ98200.1 hypothetical protein CTN02_10690 [Lysinibacillus sphaericus]